MSVGLTMSAVDRALADAINALRYANRICAIEGEPEWTRRTHDALRVMEEVDTRAVRFHPPTIRPGIVLDEDE